MVRDEEGTWHINCLAIGDGWTMGVMARYPAGKGYEHGAKICQSVAQQLIAAASTSTSASTSASADTSP